MEIIIYFIRHAKSSLILRDERNSPLSNKGIEDSLKVKQKLSNIRFDLFVNSPYERNAPSL